MCFALAPERTLAPQSDEQTRVPSVAADLALIAVPCARLAGTASPEPPPPYALDQGKERHGEADGQQARPPDIVGLAEDLVGHTGIDKGKGRMPQRELHRMRRAPPMVAPRVLGEAGLVTEAQVATRLTHGLMRVPFVRIR